MYSVTIQLDAVKDHDDLVLQMVSVLTLLENRKLFGQHDVLATLDQAGPKKVFTGAGDTRKKLGKIGAKWRPKAI